MDENMQHAPAHCTVCNKELAFIGYGSKIGKDGREAKWPMYEKCDKALHKNRPVMEVADAPAHWVADAPIRIVDGRSGPKGRLWQFEGKSGDEQIKSLNEGIALFTSYEGKAPSEIRINPIDIAGLLGADGIAITNVVADDRLTPGYRYALMVFQAS